MVEEVLAADQPVDGAYKLEWEGEEGWRVRGGEGGRREDGRRGGRGG